MVLLAMIKMQQVHGDKVVLVGVKDDGKTIKNCDGLITNTKGLSLSISVADCLPVFFYSPTINSIGVVHAGWRGLAKGIIGKAIEKMEKMLKVNSKKLMVYIGPHICQKHYEVKKDVADIFLSHSKALKKVKGKIFLDLEEVARQQLVKMGVKKESIQFDKRCTYEDKSVASFRRSGTKKGTRYVLSLPDSP
jgi:hypothetical protein